MTDTINEGTSAWLTVTFKDQAGANAAPTSATYQVDCLTTGTAVRAATAMGAGAAVEIALTEDDTAIQLAANATERKRVSVIGSYGAGDKVKAQYDFIVTNLSEV